MAEPKSSVLKQIRLFQKDMKDVEIIRATEAYGYYYATLQDIHKVIDPYLEKHNLWYSHHTGYDITTGCNVLTTVVYNVNDEEDAIVSTTLIDKEATLAKMNRFMTEGSAITYFRRYHLTTMLGLLTDEDHDAGGKRVKKGEGRSVESRSEPPTKVDFVGIFTKQAATKTKDQFAKTFEAYKSQMTNEDIQAVTQIMTDTYGN